MTHPIKLDDIKIDRKSFLNLARLFAHEEGTVLLYSGGDYETSNRSYLCLFPYESVWIQNDKQYRSHPNGEIRYQTALSDPWKALKGLFPSFSISQSYPEWIGFITYEMGAFSDPEKRIPFLPLKEIPQAYFQKCAIVLVVDHREEKGTVWIADQGEYFLNDEHKEWVARLSRPQQWQELLQGLSELTIYNELGQSFSLARPIESFESYQKKIITAKELIDAGTLYQINLSQQFSLKGYVDPFQLFHQICAINPAPFSAYLYRRDYSIVSSSPERLLKKRGLGLESRPIKGTSPRGKTPEEDQWNKEQLLNSEKERAELLMITDLIRNDLGKVSRSGSVETVKIWDCEAYSNVFHLVSVVRSQALPNLHPIDILRACFPGGSITGCPKLSAMELIAELEQRSRGIYTGAIGYISSNGDFDFNIAIRTLMLADDLLTIQLGGAIVADSEPEKEYRETLYKGDSIFKAIGFDISGI